MAFKVVSFKLAGNDRSRESGNIGRQEFTYKLLCEDPTVDKLWAWLWSPSTPAASSGGVPDDGMEQPDATYAMSGRPIPVAFNGRSLVDISYRKSKLESNPHQYVITAEYDTESPDTITQEPGKGDTPSVTSEIGFDTNPDDETIYTPLQRLLIAPGVGQSIEKSTTGAEFTRPINLKQDGTADGVKPPQASQVITLKITADNQFFTRQYVRSLARLRGHVCSKPFPETWPASDRWAAGEVRFLGTSGNVRLDLQEGVKSTLHYKFGIRENRTNLTFDQIDESDAFGWDLSDPDNITYANQTQIHLQGWDYLWVYYEDGTRDGKVLPVAKALHVDRIFFRSDLNGIFG